MKKLILLAILVATLAEISVSQSSNANVGGVNFGSGASTPTSCTAPSYFYNRSTGVYSTCTAGAYAAIGTGSVVLNNVEFDNGTCITSKTIDPANGNRQKITLTNANTCALTFTNPVNATADVRLKIVQSTAGSFNGGISGGKWPAAVIPTITQTSAAIDIISCYLDGTNAYCVPSQDFR